MGASCVLPSVASLTGRSVCCQKIKLVHAQSHVRLWSFNLIIKQNDLIGYLWNHNQSVLVSSCVLDCFIKNGYPKVASSRLSKVSSTFSDFQKAYEGDFWCWCTVTFGQKVPKLNSRPVYCSRLYGICNFFLYRLDCRKCPKTFLSQCTLEQHQIAYVAPFSTALKCTEKKKSWNTSLWFRRNLTTGEMSTLLAQKLKKDKVKKWYQSLAISCQISSKDSYILLTTWRTHWRYRLSAVSRATKITFSIFAVIS